MPSPKGSSRPMDQMGLMSPSLASEFFIIEPPGKPSMEIQ